MGFVPEMQLIFHNITINFQLAMRNAIESSFNETTLQDEGGDDDDAKRKVFVYYKVRVF